VNVDRRKIMRTGAATLAVLGAGLGVPGCARNERSPIAADPVRQPPGLDQALGRAGVPFRALREGDRVELRQGAEQVLEKAYQLGRQFEKDHGGCARCTVAALQKALDFAPEDPGLFRAASCLDGGATPHGRQSCGGFTGAGMYIGWICGTEGFQSARLSHRLIRNVHERFEQRYGSILCKDVRRAANGDCIDVVASAARWTTEALLAQFADYHAAARGDSLA